MIRKVRRFYEQGIELATKRRAVLEQIIRGDPKRHELSLDEETLSMLPNAMQSLEKWVYDYVDFQAMQFVVTLHTQQVLSKSMSLFPMGSDTGVDLREKKQNAHNQGLVAWGIRLGEILPWHGLTGNFSPICQKFIQRGDGKTPYLHDYEKTFCKRNIICRETNKVLFNYAVPQISSSLGLTEYYERKYDFNSSRLTWEEANQSATDGGVLFY